MRQRSFSFSYFFIFLISDARLPLPVKFQLMNKFLTSTVPLRLGSRSASRNFCLVTGFPRGISSTLLLFSRHEYNRRVVSGRIPGFKKA